MPSSQKFLEKCGKLKDKGINFEFEQGITLARGFADLGIEEFVMLGSNKICSLYSGKISELPDEEKKHFFAVPTEDMLADKIIKSGFDIQGLEFKDQRAWNLSVTDVKTQIAGIFSGASIKDALLDCLLAPQGPILYSKIGGDNNS